MSGKSLWQYLLLHSRGQDTKSEHGKHAQGQLNTSTAKVILKENNFSALCLHTFAWIQRNMLGFSSNANWASANDEMCHLTHSNHTRKKGWIQNGPILQWCPSVSPLLGLSQRTVGQIPKLFKMDKRLEKDTFSFAQFIFSFLNRKTSRPSEHKRLFPFGRYTSQHFQPKLKAVSSHSSQQHDLIPLLWLLPFFLADLPHVRSPVAFDLSYSDYLTSLPIKSSHTWSLIMLEQTAY